MTALAGTRDPAHMAHGANGARRKWRTAQTLRGANGALRFYRQCARTVGPEKRARLASARSTGRDA